MAERILGGQTDLDTQKQVATSTEYAQRLKELDPRYLPRENVVDPSRLVTNPKDPYLEALLDFVPGKELWALFSPPPDFEGQMKQIFTYGLCPSLGTQEQLESKYDHLMEMSEALKDGDLEEKQEQKKMTDFFQLLLKLNAMTEEQHARRNEFGKG